MRKKILSKFWLLIVASMVPLIIRAQNTGKELQINDADYYESPGVNVLVFSNWYDGLFSDSKISGVEIIHHGVRTVTNGDVRLHATPEQWDPIPTFIDRKVDKELNTIEAFLSYPNYDFEYSIKTVVKNNGILLSVYLEDMLPDELIGTAGLNLEFLPSAYFGKTFTIDGDNKLFPHYPSGPTQIKDGGETVPIPIGMGKKIILAPEDPEKRISITSSDSELLFYDGRNKAQNGWFVLRSLIPGSRTGKVIEWFIEPNTIDNWIREPQILYSQVGYHPGQKKEIILEFDKNDTCTAFISIFKLEENGNIIKESKSIPEYWGKYKRYKYYKTDISSIQNEGIYLIKYDTLKSETFIVSNDIYEKTWQSTLDIFFPVQMDHMLINEAYRVWHGASHLDDALQAPISHKHFDLYEQGPTTDSKYKPGEHIPGLNIGGWYDAGDYDIRTQTQYYVVRNLVQIWEQFNIKRDETYINYDDKYVDLHHPDGVPDLIQQIEHGTIALLAQHRSVGHAIPGIIVPTLDQYTHLGDGQTMTDNLIYNADLGPNEIKDGMSGKFDDRWAFTSRSTPLNYGSIAALAAASRVLGEYNKELADECLATAEKVWIEEHSHGPYLFKSGNTTGGNLKSEELNAALELYIATENEKYLNKIYDSWSELRERFLFNAQLAARVAPYLNDAYSDSLRILVADYKKLSDSILEMNPFGVPITEGGWAGNGTVINFSINNYLLHKLYPEIIEKEDVYKGLHYIFGLHPQSNISFVSGVGRNTKKVAYGMNRADFSYIPGGIVPGVLIIKPDYPENKEDWPFFWGQNEYVINVASSYIYLVNAVSDLLNK